MWYIHKTMLTLILAELCIKVNNRSIKGTVCNNEEIRSIKGTVRNNEK